MEELKDIMAPESGKEVHLEILGSEEDSDGV